MLFSAGKLSTLSVHACCVAREKARLHGQVAGEISGTRHTFDQCPSRQKMRLIGLGPTPLIVAYQRDLNMTTIILPDHVSGWGLK